MPIRFYSPLLKLGYGYDTSGEVQTDSGSTGQQQNIEESNGAQPQEGHGSPKNPANFLTDNEADEEFPELNRPSRKRFLPSRGLW